jgi:hypothetical protein
VEYHRDLYWVLLLFNLYLHDFPSKVNGSSDKILFADDTSILVSSSDYNVLNRNLNININKYV